ncbi:MAG: Rhamnulokinase [Bacteroidota bacterium]
MVLIFDIGKTNKKAFIFDENYQIVWEKSVHLPETTDEDGDTCEDIALLSAWLTDTWAEIQPQYAVKAINFSTYGASLVYLDENGKPLTPLYNYLKPYPKVLTDKFYEQYGGKQHFAVVSASPVLESLNSGMQLYRLKELQKTVFEQIKYVLHLPQYVSSLFSQKYYADLTSIGCHTNFWDFTTQTYHDWVENEGILSKLPPIQPAQTAKIENGIAIGIGLHDSSAALIPYLLQFKEPFLLLSTGTWNIALNPFNDNPLTYKELEQDCLCYLTYEGQPVKASRLFAGHEHETQIHRLATHFKVNLDAYKTVNYNPSMIAALRLKSLKINELSQFENYEMAYHQLMLEIMNQQIKSIHLILNSKSKVQRIFVDGGFAKNELFMSLLAAAFPNLAIFAAEIAQASALGAASILHKDWNSKPNVYPKINLKKY